MPILDQRIVESKIFENSIEGLRQMLGRVAANYNAPPVRSVVTASGFIQREVQQAFGGQIEYPFIGLTIVRVSSNQNGYNNNLRRVGKSVRSGDKILTYKLTPVIATIRARYFTQDNGDLIRFATRWLTRQKDAQYIIANDKLNINITVRLSNDLGVPEQDVTEWGNIFQLETDCEISSYLGDIESTSAIKQINLTTNLWDRTKQIPLASRTRQITPKSLQ